MKDALLRIAEAFEALEARIATQEEYIAAQEERITALEARIEELENAEPEVEVELVPMPIEEELEPAETEESEETEVPAEPEVPETLEISAEPEVPETPEIQEEPAESEASEKPERKPEEPKPEEPKHEEPRRPVQTSLFGMQVDDIRHAISLGDRFLFQRELFNGNGELMQKTLDDLNELGSFSDAMNYISRFDWNQESGSYELFLNVLRRRF